MLRPTYLALQPSTALARHPMPWCGWCGLAAAKIWSGSPASEWPAPLGEAHPKCSRNLGHPAEPPQMTQERESLLLPTFDSREIFT